MKLVLVGNYGVGNLGDEALKRFFLERFPGVVWTVVSAHPGPGEVPRLPFGMRSLLQPWWRTLRAVRHADGVVFGGGSLLTDIESPYACMLWWWHAAVAHCFGKPVFWAFQGVGPFCTKTGEFFARSALRNARFVSVRDRASFHRAETVTSIKVIQTFDPVISLLQEKKNEQRSKKVLTIIPRKNSGAPLRNRALALYGKGWEDIRILSLEPHHPHERNVCRLLAGQIRARVLPIHSLADLEREVGQSTLVLTQRYHGALAAWAAGTPVEIISQGEGDKLAEFDPDADLAAMMQLVWKGEQTLREAIGIRG